MGKQKEFVAQDVAATLEKIKLNKSRWEGVWGTCSAHAVHSSETSESDTRSCQSCQSTVVCLLMLADTLQVTDMARRETWIVSCGRILQQQGWWNLCCSSGGGDRWNLIWGKSEQTCWAVLSELIGEPAHAVNLDIASHISICRCVRMADERWRASRFLTIVICATHIHNCCFQKLLFHFYVILTISIWSVSYAPWYLRSLPC